MAGFLEQVRSFARRLHEERRFTCVLCIGIGGSALGPMFVADALGQGSSDVMRVRAEKARRAAEREAAQAAQNVDYGVEISRIL